MALDLHKYIEVQCTCGCGQYHRIRSAPSQKGKSFIRGHYKPLFRKGGITFHKKRKRFYVTGFDGDKIPYARAIVESVLKRELKSDELVHHVNGNSMDDRKCNLLVCDQSYHNWLHAKGAERVLYAR